MVWLTFHAENQTFSVPCPINIFKCYLQHERHQDIQTRSEAVSYISDITRALLRDNKGELHCKNK